jgi:hypothetical protein
MTIKIKKHLNFSSLRKKASGIFEQIQDYRQTSKTKISIHDAMMSGLACMFFQGPSLLQFQQHLQDIQHQNNLKTLFNVACIPKETQMREIIDEIDSQHFAAIFKDYYQRLQRSKQLEQFQILKNVYYFPMDGSEFFSSKEIHCIQCLRKEHKKGEITYSHCVLQGGIMHPNCSQVIPFMPEQIVNTDGKEKQDCEMNAAKRYIKKLRQGFPQLKLMVGGDSLFSRQPLIQDIIEQKMHYLFAAKPTDHKYMMEWLDTYSSLNHYEFTDKKGMHSYEWMNQVPLHGGKDAIKVNYLCYTMTGKNKRGQEKVLFRNSWVTDINVSKENIEQLVKAGRCRWKNENECFNVMKNHGYCMEHNYGHGQKNLAYNFYLLTLVAFFMHQIFELTDKLYQACRKKMGSKNNLWGTIRSYIKIIVFETWEQVLAFVLKPLRFELSG